MTDNYQPTPQDKFTFGLWTVGNGGRDPFGDPVRKAPKPDQLVHLLAEAGAYGVNFHDNDLVPFNASPAEREAILKDFKKALADTGLVVPMATTDLFHHPIFKDGAFTANDPKVRVFAIQKVLRAMDLGAEVGAKLFVFWGGREGVESDATKNPVDAMKRFREAINFFSEYSIDNGYGYRFAMEAKPNEPRGDIYFPTTASYLAFINTLDHPEMVGVNPEMAHEHMAGLNFLHAVAQAWEAGKLFHIDLNDQNYARYDQDYRFGMQNIKQSFFLVKFLEDVAYDGSRHFDAHALRSEDMQGVKDFARGCMRTYLMLKEKARQWNQDKEIQAMVQEMNAVDPALAPLAGKYSREKADQIKKLNLDADAVAARGLGYEKLDQLTIDLILGTR
jgi:xylose isomerase